MFIKTSNGTKKFVKSIFQFLLSVLALFSFQIPVFGGITVTNNPVTITNPLGSVNTIQAFVFKIVDLVFQIGAVISVFFIIYAGFLMVTAGSNETKLSSARQAFLWTVIGVGILLGAKVLSAVICGTINQLGTPTLVCTIPS